MSLFNGSKTTVDARRRAQANGINPHRTDDRSLGDMLHAVDRIRPTQPDDGTTFRPPEHGGPTGDASSGQDDPARLGVSHVEWMNRVEQVARQHALEQALADPLQDIARIGRTMDYGSMFKWGMQLAPLLKADMNPQDVAHTMWKWCRGDTVEKEPGAKDEPAPES